MGPAAATHPVPSGGKPGGHGELGPSLCPLKNGQPWAGPGSAHPWGPSSGHLLEEDLRGQGLGLWGVRGGCQGPGNRVLHTPAQGESPGVTTAWRERGVSPLLLL